MRSFLNNQSIDCIGRLSISSVLAGGKVGCIPLKLFMKIFIFLCRCTVFRINFSFFKYSLNIFLDRQILSFFIVSTFFLMFWIFHSKFFFLNFFINNFFNLFHLTKNDTPKLDVTPEKYSYLSISPKTCVLNKFHSFFSTVINIFFLWSC